MGNKVAPAPVERQPSSSASLLDSMKTYVRSKLCYHSKAIINAKVLNTEERVAYQSDLWTLMERRWVKKRTKPYNGEFVDPDAICNPWVMEFPKETTVLKKNEKQKYDLDETRCIIVCDKCRGYPRKSCNSCAGTGKKQCTCSGFGTGLYADEQQNCTRCGATGYMSCSTCDATGIINCYDCEARGNLLFWYQVIVEYYTLHSTSYQTNTPLSSDRIRKAPGKTVHWSFDKKWSKECAFDNYLQTTLANGREQYLMKLDQLSEQYKKEHLDKTTPECRILRLKSQIQKLNVTEVEYEAEGFMNKRNTIMNNKFKFYYYGRGKKNEPLIYEDDYPLNACGCFSAVCAHYSKCCTVS